MKTERLEKAYQDIIDSGKMEDNDRCCVCLTNPKDVIIKPCLHQCICYQCFQLIDGQNQKCPLCKQKWTGKT